MNQKHPIFEVIPLVREYNYQIATLSGLATDVSAFESEFTRYGFGLLRPRPPERRQFLGFNYKQKRPALHLGNFYFEGTGGASLDSRWFLEVFGREHLRELQSLARRIELVRPGIGVEVILGSEDIRYELDLRGDD